ncbi:hypothetical protein H9635_10080 [Solibacillus sp. A46]|uniref:Uncharacterized protein n=1 Tax=Solibacillus faecavium TaxID=2762221 RepID=A0ABR8XYS3_9BACL|nr:hypothetical protein [Solibacillus faecavium]MBD8037093.1 hypothetical protein [Solibacillus faecavium]
MVSTRRKALETLWHGTCDVIGWGEVTDPLTHITKPGEFILHQSLKCKLSHKNISATSQTGAGAIIVQQIKLSLGNEHDIPAGCKIIVSQNGKTAEYARSGEPAVFIDHQEIVLDVFKGWT